MEAKNLPPASRPNNPPREGIWADTELPELRRQNKVKWLTAFNYRTPMSDAEWDDLRKEDIPIIIPPFRAIDEKIWDMSPGNPAKFVVEASSGNVSTKTVAGGDIEKRAPSCIKLSEPKNQDWFAYRF
jgi:hypothetical protein